MNSFEQFIKEMADFSNLPSRYVFHETPVISLISILEMGRICSPKVQDELKGDGADMNAAMRWLTGRKGIYTTVNRTKKDLDYYYGVADNECLIVIDVGSLPRKGRYEPKYEGGLYTIHYCIPVNHFVEIVCYTSKQFATIKRLCNKLNIKVSKMRRKDILTKYFNMRTN